MDSYYDVLLTMYLLFQLTLIALAKKMAIMRTQRKRAIVSTTVVRERWPANVNVPTGPSSTVNCCCAMNSKMYPIALAMLVFSPQLRNPETFLVNCLLNLYEYYLNLIDYICVLVYSFDCSQKAEGIYPAGDCNDGYWACVGGMTSEIKCPEGLFYDGELMLCEKKEFIPSCGGVRPTHLPLDETSESSIGSFLQRLP